jgi:hypothetical protein
MLWVNAEYGFRERVYAGALKSVDTEAYGFLQSMGYDRVDCVDSAGSGADRALCGL